MNEMMNEMMKEMMNQMMTAMMQSMMSAMTGSKTELPNIFDFSSQGIEDSKPGNAVANTPSAPSKKTSDVKTKYEIVEDEVDGKKVYRIKNGIYKKAVSAKKVANNYIKALDGIQTGKFSFELEDGTTQEYTGWYFTKKKDAESALKTLPEKVLGSEIDAEYNKYLAWKASH